MLHFSQVEIARFRDHVFDELHDITGDHLFLRHVGILLALFSRDVRKTARFLGVHPRTVHRWLDRDGVTDPHRNKGFTPKLEASQRFRLRQAIRATLEGRRHSGRVGSPEALQRFV